MRFLRYFLSSLRPGSSGWLPDLPFLFACLAWRWGFVRVALWLESVFEFRA